MTKRDGPGGAKGLRYGYTTGSCATAAVKGALAMIADQVAHDRVNLCLPNGDTARFDLHGQRFDDRSAHCYVIKDAGDDPDITNRAELHASVQYQPAATSEIIVTGGIGIGRVTKPGLAVKPGNPAINPVPMQMIREVAEAFLAQQTEPCKLSIEISIPDGEERAKKTLNERLGIIGGLSILGTTGIVVPLSNRAWTDTIDVELNVAKAAGFDQLLFAGGRTSELAGIEATGIAEDGRAMVGDYIGYAMEVAAEKGFKKVSVAVQFAKLCKIAQGHKQTHVRNSRLDFDELADWGREAGYSSDEVDAIANANTARELFERFGPESDFVRVVLDKGLVRLSEWGRGLLVEVVLVDYAGGVACI